MTITTELRMTQKLLPIVKMMCGFQQKERKMVRPPDPF